MNLTKTFATFCVAGLLACGGTSEEVGQLPGEGTESPGVGSTAVALRNVVATVTNSYDCPAGIMLPYDEMSGPCACDTSYDCQVGCGCDQECYQARPMIQCADYSVTFVLDNGEARAIDRLTELELTVGSFSMRRAGLSCIGADTWALQPGTTSSILNVTAAYDAGYDERYASPQIGYPCPREGRGDATAIIKPGGDPDLGEPLPPATTSGALILELSGLFADGSPWKAAATADLTQ